MTLQIGFLVFPGIQLLDLAGPVDVFAGAKETELHLIWKNLDPVQSSSGLTFQPTTTFEDSPALDVICVPGGGGVNDLLGDEDVLSFLRARASQAKFLTSVCTGSMVLGAAGLLKGKRATAHWYAIDFLSRYDAIPTEGRVVRDGNLITAGGVTSGIDFGLTLLAELMGEAEAETVQLSLEYAPEPPFSAGTPCEATPEILAAAKERLSPSRKKREELLATH